MKKLKKKKLHCELFTIGVEKIETNERYEDIKFEDIKLESLKMYHLECGSKITTSEIANGKRYSSGDEKAYLSICCEKCKIRIWLDREEIISSFKEDPEKIIKKTAIDGQKRKIPRWGFIYGGNIFPGYNPEILEVEINGVSFEHNEVDWRDEYHYEAHIIQKVPETSEELYCPFCGVQLISSATYCPSCGIKIEDRISEIKGVTAEKQ